MRVLTLMALVLVLGGCTLSAPGVHARVGEPIRVEVGSEHDGNGCPPGLRKQGRC